MSYHIRSVEKDDEPFLWEMLYFAAHMEEEGETSLQAARKNTDLARYVRDWGRETDRGCLALDQSGTQPLGAAWIRLLIGDEKTISYIDDVTPELVIAVLPEYLGKGVGSQLLTHILDLARERYSSIVLSVRATNPARRLYERMGFVAFNTTQNRVGTESIIMRRSLLGMDKPC